MAFTLRTRSATFIDGANIYGTSRELGMDIDYKKLLRYVSKDYELVRALYYTAVYEEKDGNRPIQQLMDFLNLNGFLVKSKPAKAFSQGSRMIIKGNMDLEIAVDALRMVKHVSHMYLFSGDGDFRYLIEAIQNEGVRVTVVSSLKAKVCSIELCRQADEFIELEDLRGLFQRER